jgi:hypothetical protein
LLPPIQLFEICVKTKRHFSHWQFQRVPKWKWAYNSTGQALMSKLVIEYEQNSPSALTQAAKIKGTNYFFLFSDHPTGSFSPLPTMLRGTIISLHGC